MVSSMNSTSANGLVIYKPNICPKKLMIKLGINNRGLEKLRPRVEPPSDASNPDLYSVSKSKTPT